MAIASIGKPGLKVNPDTIKPKPARSAGTAPKPSAQGGVDTLKQPRLPQQAPKQTTPPADAKPKAAHPAPTSPSKPKPTSSPKEVTGKQVDRRSTTDKVKDTAKDALSKIIPFAGAEGNGETKAPKAPHSTSITNTNAVYDSDETIDISYSDDIPSGAPPLHITNIDYAGGSDFSDVLRSSEITIEAEDGSGGTSSASDVEMSLISDGAMTTTIEANGWSYTVKVEIDVATGAPTSVTVLDAERTDDERAPHDDSE